VTDVVAAGLFDPPSNQMLSGGFVSANPPFVCTVTDIYDFAARFQAWTLRNEDRRTTRISS
jgi:hypothetical protein